MDAADKQRDRERAAGGFGGTCSGAAVSRSLLAVFAALVLAGAVVTNLLTSWWSTALPRFSLPAHEQPYYFEALAGDFSEQPDSWKLHSYDPECELRPMAEQFANGSGDGLFVDRLVVILYGDSIDRTLVRDFCKLAGAEFRADPEPATSRCYQSVIWCSTDKFLLMMSWTNGMHSQQGQPPEQAFQQSRDKLLELTGRMAPDLVVIASGMWDVVNWKRNITWWPGPGDPRKAGTSPYLGQERLGGYVADMKSYIAMVQDGFSSGGAAPVMVTHTAPLRNPRALMALESLDKRQVTGEDALRLPAGHSRELQWNNYLAAINAALRHASRQMGLPVIDYEPVALQLPEAHLHMADGLHPQGKLLATIFFNLMLNEYAAAQERSVAKRSRHQWSRSTVQSAST